jgi:multiple sugar transport system substrate-binding protein
VGDQVYGLALGTNSQAVMIDTDLLQQAGLELPSPDWTWVEFEETCLAIHEALDIWCFGGTLTDEALWKSLFLGHGLWVFNEAGTAIGYEDDQPLVDYLDMILRLMDAGALPTVEKWAEYRDLGPEGNPIVSGKAAMAYHWSNQVVAVTNAAGEGRNFKLWHLPRPDGGQPENYVKPSQFFSVTTQAKFPDEAAAFIDFFTNSMEANAILAAERGVPVSSVVRDQLASTLSPIEQEAFDFLARVEADSSPVPQPSGGWPISATTFMDHSSLI